MFNPNNTTGGIKVSYKDHILLLLMHQAMNSRPILYSLTQPAAILHPISWHVCCSCTLPAEVFVAFTPYQKTCLSQLHPTSRHVCLSCTLQADMFVAVGPYQQTCLSQLSLPADMFAAVAHYQQTCLLHLHPIRRHVCFSCPHPQQTASATYQQTCLC